MAVGVTMLLAQEIADANGEQTGAYPAVLGFMMWMMVIPILISAELLTLLDATGTALNNGDTSLIVANLLESNSLGAVNLFTGLLFGILGTECFCKLRTVDALKIKMPDSVPPGVARGFELLIFTCII